MAITGIYTQLNDTAFGTAVVSDGVAMLIGPATAESVSGGLPFELNTAYLLQSSREIERYLTTANNAAFVHHITEFYEKAGQGAKLWIVGIAANDSGAWNELAAGPFQQIIRSTTATSFDNRPRLVGLFGDENWASEEVATGSFLNAWAVNAAEVMETQLTEMFDQGYRMVGVVDAVQLDAANPTGIVNEALATTLQNGGDLDLPRTGMLLTTSTPGQTASVGELLGRMAAISIASSIGSVPLGPLRAEEYFLDHNGGAYVNTPVTSASEAIYRDLGSKQYIFSRSRNQLSGVFYNDGATLNDPTMALSTLEFVRVGNAVCDSVERFFVEMIGTNVTTTTSGEIAPAYKATQLADLDQRYLRPRIERGEAQLIQVDFWAKDGNFLTSRAIEVNVRIFPNAALREVFIDVSFVTSLT